VTLRRTPPPLEHQLEVLKLARRYVALAESHKRSFFTPYDWQREFFAKGATHSERVVCAGNRVGKTASETYEVAVHATGDYPEWWEGLRFNHAPTIWCFGVTSEQLVAVLQRQLFGDITADGITGGMIAPHEVVEVTRGLGSPNLIRSALVKHKNGKLSRVELRAYTQSKTGTGTLSFAGVELDYALVDEQAPDSIVYQVLTRLMTGNKGKGGAFVNGMTPELGLTPYLTDCFEKQLAHRFVMRVSWDDAPHLTPEMQAKMLESIPAWQHAMRRDGVPTLGSGLIYPLPEDRITCEPFDIPPHFRVLRAIDLGYSHPTAGAWLAYDAERDIVFLTKTYKRSGEVPAVHAAALNAVWPKSPVVFPHDADNTEKGSGVTMAQLYREAGIGNQLIFTNEDGSRFVEPGLLQLFELMRSDRFKVFADCADFLREFRGYHRDDNGKIVKELDDIMDAVRYGALMVKRYGVRLADVSRTGELPLNRAGQVRYAPELEGLS
jgi:hypothetical protein